MPDILYIPIYKFCLIMKEKPYNITSGLLGVISYCPVNVRGMHHVNRDELLILVDFMISSNDEISGFAGTCIKECWLIPHCHRENYELKNVFFGGVVWSTPFENRCLCIYLKIKTKNCTLTYPYRRRSPTGDSI